MSDNIIKKLTKFGQDILEQSPKVFAIARLVRVGPRHMVTIEKHTAYNTAAISIAVAALVLSRKFISTGSSIDVGSSLISTALAVFFFLGVGFVVNLLERGDGNAESEEIEGTALANKWSTFMILNFAVLIIVYWVATSISLTFSNGNETFLGVVDSFFGFENFTVTQWVTVLICSALGSAIVLSFCHISSKIIDPLNKVWSYFLVSTLVCAFPFYLINFYFV